MLADARKFRHKWNSSIREDVFGTNTTIAQNGWTANTTTCADDLFLDLHRQLRRATVGAVLNGVGRQVTLGRRGVEENPSDMGVSKYIVIWTRWEWVEIP